MVAHWDGSAWDLPLGGGIHSIIGNNVAGTVTATNVTSFSPFTIGSSEESALPVELLYFRAAVSAGVVNLEWETASELNNDYFTIERSCDGMSFAQVGRMKGNGTVSHSIKYHSRDPQPLSGISYYRLKQTDFDGTEAYSDVVLVNLSRITTKEARIYPNPSNGKEVILTLTGFIPGKSIPITLYDQTGRLLTTRLLDGVGSQGSGEFQLIMDQPLPDGVYFLQIGGEGTLVRRLIVLKQ